MEQVVGRFRARRVGARGSFASRLARTGRCRVCEALDRAPAGVTFAGSNSDELAAEANRLRFTREWPQQTRAVWQPHYLEGLGARLDALGRSMRQGAAAPTVEQEASWIETMGCGATSTCPWTRWAWRRPHAWAATSPVPVCHGW